MAARHRDLENCHWSRQSHPSPLLDSASSYSNKDILSLKHTFFTIETLSRSCLSHYTSVSTGLEVCKTYFGDYLLLSLCAFFAEMDTRYSHFFLKFVKGESTNKKNRPVDCH